MARLKYPTIEWVDVFNCEKVNRIQAVKCFFYKEQIFKKSIEVILIPLKYLEIFMLLSSAHEQFRRWQPYASQYALFYPSHSSVFHTYNTL